MLLYYAYVHLALCFLGYYVITVRLDCLLNCFLNQISDRSYIDDSHDIIRE